MKNLGKIIIFFLMSASLFAEVKVSVDKANITRGERVTMTLRITGEGQFRIPPFDELCGYSIEGRMQSVKEVFTNAKRVKEMSRMYEFMPQRSCVIESFPVSINGKEEQTSPINITVSKVAISTNEPLTVELFTEKKSVYVGEPFEMKVRFKQRQTIDGLAESISLPENKNIWIKSQKKGSPFVKDQYSIRDNQYAISAQQSGKLSLGPLRWDLKVRSKRKDFWNTWIATTKVRTMFSNELDMEVKELPVDVNLVGDLSIEAKINKTEINAGEAVNLTINVKGRANIEDVDAFDIYVSGAQAFKEEPKITHYLQEGKYYGTFVQKMALVAEHDFVIPSFELKYMDVESDTVKTIKTEPISIKVLNASPALVEEVKITRAEPKDEPIENFRDMALTYTQAVFLILGGFVLGLITALIPWKRIMSREKKKQLISAKESKKVLQLLMGNMDQDEEVADLAKKISANLYEGTSHNIDKKHLKDILKRLQK